MKLFGMLLVSSVVVGVVAIVIAEAHEDENTSLLLRRKLLQGGGGSSNGDGRILIEDFSNPVHKWSTMNDPVMGGKSKSSLSIDKTNGVAKFTGTCAIVPFLEAPGFVTMVTGGFFSFHREVFPDVSSCNGLSFTMKTNTPYQGYRISFGKEHVNGGGHASGYKAGPLVNIPTDEFDQVVIPFTEFSSKWDEATGDITVSCLDDSQYCPNQRWLSNMETISFWGEGVEGDIDLEIQKIEAVGCTTSSSSDMSTSMSARDLLSANIGGGTPNLMMFGCAFVAVVVVFTVQQKRKRRQIRSSYDEIPTLS